MKPYNLIIGCIVLATNLLHAQTPTAAPPPAEKSPWTFSTNISFKETYDDNVFIQDISNLANKSSMVSSLTPSISLSYQADPSFKATASYAPEIVYYHSYSSEDYVAHRGALNLGGKTGDTAWELNNSFTAINGSDTGPTFDIAHGGAVPAIGGIPLRDRRDALIYRGSLKATQTIGQLFIRPVLTAYVHDFKTVQSSATGYENYIDRYDVNGGVDVGYEAMAKTWLVLGYRFGYQNQGTLLGAPSPYDNYYHRILFGVEGAPTEWLKLSAMAGPEFRNFTSGGLPSGFEDDEVLLFVDASATLTLGKDDTISILLTRFEQPAFSSFSVYQDVVYGVNWRHQFNEKLACQLGLKIYQGDWQEPVLRDDWIYTPSFGLTYSFDKQFSADFAVSYDTVDSQIPNTEGREYTRLLLSLGIKYTF